MAEAMGCRLVYAIVPANGSVDDLILLQARKKARALVTQAGTHMAPRPYALMNLTGSGSSTLRRARS